MSYTVRGMCGDSAKVIEEFRSLEEARVLFEQLKMSDRYSSVELDDITNPDNPDIIDHVVLGGIEEEEEEGGGGGGGGEVEKELRAIIDAQAAYIAELDIAIAAQKAELATLRCSVCGALLRGDFRASGQGLCAKCQPAKCIEEGCGARLNKTWRFVAKCRVHGGYEGLPE